MMTKRIFTLIFAVLAVMACKAQTFTLKSADLGGQFSNEFIAGNFGCNGQNHSPQLQWLNAPAASKSFAITMYDTDAPTGSGFWHWVMVDIPSTVTELKRDAGNPASNIAPKGSLQSMNDTGASGYQGPCPGEGEAPHHYIITVYALDTEKLGTATISTAALTGFMLHQHTLAKASLLVYCKR